jgi:riboflavin kinase / FMN adenylyltransferase
VKIYNSIEEFSPDFKVVLTLGTFDGVHIGHQSIVRQLNKNAQKIGGESVLLTFYPHPRYVIFPDDQKLKLLTTIEERSQMLENYGLDHLIIQEFTPEFSRIKSVNFVRDVLVNKLKVNKLIIGYDHHFGRNREGNFQELANLSDLYGYEIQKIEPQRHQDVSVSSSKIRKLILEDEIKTASDYLGHLFCLKGKIVKGKQIGRSIGYPTANILIDNKWKLLPTDGSYAVWAEVDGQKYKAMMNIGFNPTFPPDKRTVEVHILDFNEDIYGKEMRVSVVQKLRNEKKFNSVGELKKTLEIDENKVRNILI